MFFRKNPTIKILVIGQNVRLANVRQVLDGLPIKVVQTLDGVNPYLLDTGVPAKRGDR